MNVVNCKQCGKPLDRKYFLPICQDCYSKPTSNIVDRREFEATHPDKATTPKRFDKPWQRPLALVIFFPALTHIFIDSSTIPAWISAFPLYLLFSIIGLILSYVILTAMIYKAINKNLSELPSILSILFTFLLVLPSILSCAIILNKYIPRSEPNILPAQIIEYYEPGRIPAAYSLQVTGTDGVIETLYVKASAIGSYRLRNGEKGKVSVRKGIFGIKFVESYDF